MPADTHPDTAGGGSGRASDRGSVVLEVAVLGPVSLLLLFTILQVGLWGYARSLALGAAQEGAAAGRVHGASAGAGAERANTFLTRTARGSLLDPHVVTTRTATTVRVQVTGRAQSVLPGIPGLPVRQTADAPLELFTQATP